MSVKVMTRVFADSDARGNDRLVLLAIADEADDDGTSAFPSQDRISRKSRVPKRTVQRCLDRLEEAGELVVVRPEQKGRGHFNRYELPRYAQPEARQNDVDTGPEKGAERRGKARQGGALPLDPSTPKDSRGGGKRTSPEADGLTRDWWDAMKRQGITPTGARAFVSVRGIVQTMIAEGYARGEIGEALLRLGGRTITKQKLRDQCYGVRRENEREGQATPWFQDADERPPPPTDEKPWWQRGEQAG